MDQDRRYRIRLCLAIGVFGLLMPAACSGAAQPKGQVIGIMGIGRNITLRVQAEEEASVDRTLGSVALALQRLQR